MSALPINPTERDRERFRDITKAMQFGLEYDRRLATNGDYTDQQTVAMFRLWWSVERERQLLQNLNQSQGCKISELLAQAEKAEAELARMAQQEPVAWMREDGNLYLAWQKDLCLPEVRFSPLYAAPVPAVAAPAVPEEWREVMAGLVGIAEAKGKKHGSPNHSHSRPGIWDDDNIRNGLAGKPCAECAMYDRARALLQSAPQPTHSGNAADMVKNADSSAIQHHPV